MKTFILLTVLTLILSPCSKADDPFYYQSDSDFQFLLPDKIQHFYGSWLIAEFSGVEIAASAGVVKELIDLQNGSIISPGDLLADALGILASQRIGNVQIGMDYNKPQKEVLFVFVFNF